MEVGSRYSFQWASHPHSKILVVVVEEVEGIERIRFMTSHPTDLSDELIEVMAHSKKICKHLHLPVQSGRAICST